ncbi:hypothetical protein L226DRAFT_523341 [Lentinus tigrinus ALCF2SS1-7]|uniref:Uncharacterized protein n=1 Tax=Lentinus tigrinus ALCF2SS1-6 TaxID=1328759 RepID=A0A5C2SDZ8_9APHY|nr:hypothetical protein L227DRAFT_46518 [Lentinus tigrinus ALCF2SS1-6]RPD74497.1 hypothetical protein L226DRAFT_523341 [Lentinus tigrinus ALCF2SS1-7]
MPHTNDSQSTADGSNDSRALKTKAIPPTFINLNDCKPILSTTSTNTGNNSSANGATAFVFTSSRTLRALQDEETSSFRRLSPGSIPPSPSTPSTSASDGSLHLARSRASLTLSQLVKHSDGAVDARSLLGPKMRAAGFVNLPNTLRSRSDLSCPSTPSSSVFTSVSAHIPPTPNAPPNFPPIVFFNPTVVATAPMWDYQSTMQWSLTSMEQQGVSSSNMSTCSSDSAGSSEFTPGPRQGFAFTPSPPEFSPSSSASPPVLEVSRRPVFQGSSSSSGSDSFGSSSTFASGISTSTSLSSVEETDEDMMRDRSRSSKGKGRARELEPTEYPFPSGCDSPRSHGSRGSRASSATASPTVIGAGATLFPSTRRQDLHITKPPSPRFRRRSSEEKREKAKSKAKKETTATRALQPAFEPTPTFATAKRPGCARQYSLTELCDSSPFVWLSKSEMFAPPAPISRSPIRDTVVSVISTPAASRPRPPVDPPYPPAHRHRRHHTTVDGRSHNSDPSGRVHRVPSAPLRMPTIPSEPGSPSDRESEKTRKLGRAAKERDVAPAAGPQEQDPSRARALHYVPEMADPRSTDGMSALHGQGATADLGTGGGRSRGRDTRGKMLSASETIEERAAAQAHADMDKEKAEALDGLAALALAHKEREFESARNIVADRERTKVLKQKQRAHHKLRGKPLHDEPPSESETTMVDQQASVVKLL